MSFASLPKTQRAWELTCLRCLLMAGFILLLVQIWARAALSGPTRQYIEEMIWPFPVFLGLVLLCCAVVAFVQRQRWLGLTSAIVGILSALIGLLPILLQAGIYD